VPFVLINITAYRKESRKADEELQALLKENNDLLKELLAKKSDTWDCRSCTSLTLHTVGATRQDRRVTCPRWVGRPYT